MMVTMKLIRSIICVLVVLAFVIGCAEKEAPSQKPAVVSQKISTPVEQMAAEATPQKDAATTPENAKPASTSQVNKKADADEIDKHTADLLASVKEEEAVGDMADTYNPKGKPDPFAPLFRDEPDQATASTPVVSKSKRKKRVPTTPLEKVDLSQLKLVATVRSPNGNSALVEDASGKGFIVKRGTYIGINSGSVVQIVKDRVVVEEEIETLLGEISLQKRELKLQKPPGE